MKVKFKKITTVDYHECRTDEIRGKSFYHNEAIEVASIEDNGNYVNLHFHNGDVAIDVPKNVYALL